MIRYPTIPRSVIVGLLVAVLAGWLARGAYDRPDPHAIVRADSLHAAIVTSDARSVPRLAQSARIVARATEHQAAATTHHDSAAVLGQAATHLTESLSCTDTSMLRQLGELHAGENSEHEKAYQDLQAAAKELRGVLNYVRNTLLVERTAQRDEAMRQLAVAVHARQPHRGRFVLGVVVGAAAVYAATR